MQNRDDKIKISHTFVFLGIGSIALDKYCDIISAPRASKIELFRGGEKADRSGFFNFRVNARRPRIEGRDAAREYTYRRAFN